MKIFGITGTCGKTTTSYLLEAIFRAAGERVGVIGSVNIRYPNHTVSATHTTPGASMLHATLSDMQQAGCTIVIMEVSSHGLHQHRVKEIAFDYVLFTNFSQDHLDYHKTLDAYFLAKALLFTEYVKKSYLEGKKPEIILNDQTAEGQKLKDHISQYDYAPHPVPTLHSYGNLSYEITMPRTSLAFSQLNRENLLLAVATARAAQVSWEDIQQGLMTFEGVPGRLESVPNTRGLHIFIDYAHKPAALEKILATLQSFKGPGRVLLVFGCGGERDAIKRPLMGRIANEGADHCWLTSDNPRSEDPMDIIHEIMQGMTILDKVTVISDRRAAIAAALQNANKGDNVIIAGKGSEGYQILKTVTIPFNDTMVVQELLRR
jgi:UDP-N-acetylmuramoyl-L-alanyl-D-glutamate--2,6-diaminopimelate ligase